MTLIETIIAIVTYFIIPLFGVMLYQKIDKKMKIEKIPKAPTNELFLIFSTYGILLLISLISLFLKWSGMDSIGTFYLILIAPIVMGIIAYRQRHTKTISKYHRWTYTSSLLYFAIAPFLIGALILLVR